MSVASQIRPRRVTHPFRVVEAVTMEGRINDQTGSRFNLGHANVGPSPESVTLATVPYPERSRPRRSADLAWLVTQDLDPVRHGIQALHDPMASGRDQPWFN